MNGQARRDGAPEVPMHGILLPREFTGGRLRRLRRADCAAAGPGGSTAWNNSSRAVSEE